MAGEWSIERERERDMRERCGTEEMCGQGSATMGCYRVDAEQQSTDKTVIALLAGNVEQ